jgi:2-hydroxycyclohexanecarboxyl-CoA dehydrogenase
MTRDESQSPADLLSVRGRVAIVTGAGQGIGRQIAHHLAGHGAKVAVNDYFADRAAVVAAELNDIHGNGTAMEVQADVGNFQSVLAMEEVIRQTFGQAGILVNNAGNAGPGEIRLDDFPFWEEAPENWQRWFGANLFGVMHCCRAFAPGMVEAKSGSIVTIISDAGRVGEPRLEAYSAAKAGAAGFMRALARSLGRYQVRANCVSIGTTRTPSVTVSEGAAADRQLARYVIRRFGEPNDIANMVLYLASDAAEWITGQTYPVNGGYDFAT